MLVENVGDQGSAGSVVSELVPDFTVFNDAGTTAVWTCADGSGPATACDSTLGPIPAGGSVTIDFVVTVDVTVPVTTTEIDNSVSVADDGTNGPDPDPTNDVDDVQTPIVAAPDLTAFKTDVVDLGV